jgi:hypothetical protein
MIQHGKRWEFAMAIPLRPDFDALSLRAIAKKAKNGAQARRLLALAAIYEGGTRTQAARIGSVSFRATIFDGIGGSGKPLKRIA